MIQDWLLMELNREHTGKVGPVLKVRPRALEVIGAKAGVVLHVIYYWQRTKMSTLHTIYEIAVTTHDTSAQSPFLTA